jgi:type IV fimbrial biogenesis protein FimT
MPPSNHPARRFRPHSFAGFTLVELMVTLSIAAILITLAVPSFTRQLREWQRDSATKAFTAHVQLARSEAIKTSRRVVMCSSNGTTCANSNDWSTGWLIFMDLDANNSLDSDEPILSVRQAPSGLSQMQTSGNVQRMVFMPNGLTASNPTTMSIIPSGPSDLKQNQVTVNRIGRTYVRTTDQESD